VTLVTRAQQTLRERLPDATLRYAFVQQERWLGHEAERVDLLYTFPSIKHTGLLHFVDELSWYEGDTFIVALELSKFCRLQMKAHAYAQKLIEQSDDYGLHVWPPPFDRSATLPERLPRMNRWLHGLRDAD